MTITRTSTCTADPSCCRKRRAVDDPFFSRCNRIALSSHQHPLALTEEEDTIFDIQEEEEEHQVPPSTVEWMELTTDDTATTTTGGKQEPDTTSTMTTTQSPSYSYPCCVPGCRQSFPTMMEAEVHFEESHIYQCGVCHQVFSRNHLLELHLQEVHDSFFAVSVQRGRPQQQRHFACLVETCTSVFATRQERQQHLIRRHGYPRWFRFETTTIPKEELKKKQRWIQNHNRHSPQVPTTTSTCSMHVDRSSSIIQQEKREKRRERQKMKRATIPCRYFATKEGCWRGESCMFLHDHSSSLVQQQKQQGDDTNGNAMDGLVNDMSKKAQVSVPDKICFGRKRTGPY